MDRERPNMFESPESPKREAPFREPEAGDFEEIAPIESSPEDDFRNRERIDRIKEKLQILPEYQEGHGADRDFIQSPYPFVVVTPRPDQEGAWCWLRFMGMLGIYNSWRTGRDEIRWVVIPTGNPSIAFSLRPIDISYPLADMQNGVVLLANSLDTMQKWYEVK